ncbi:MAG TPA: ABC transporter ATP-binding protein [Tenuifilaceae bacterium]|jgi:peptide/nickel transport system ATP-binding protein|nr:ABC transporter ATP-binding protein [Bacteroidales bacterium]MDI9516108.1 ABC transporter ATP-binding protein [Bacteroidota bacterium]OQC63505.1 MAG: Glutathione import ATP-binding protein GsiA [Bacteroidetes bacterium ADurb.Bin008]HNV81321.1 ABC transporter ATP-binding protein [Tenuifilaceae bacterium]MZP82645.1 dipeptide ABC transporter ATP-binding protein [Bacteroidales bacterium]
MLRVDGLTVAFGSHTVLNDLSFDLSKGESLGIVGESGSGKSIAALSLMGLLPPTASIVAGTSALSIEGSKSVNLFDITPKEHRMVRGKHMAMIFQEPMTSLNPSMRCGKQVMEAITLHQKVKANAAYEKCLSLFAEMQLPDPNTVINKYPHQLSGGQKQRVMIAMALAGNPSILIADEPTTALDVTIQQEILGLLKQITQQRGMGLIFISHDLGVISQISQRLLVIKNGMLVEQGSAKELLTHPGHPYSQGLIACRPPLNARPVRLQTVEDFISGNGTTTEKFEAIDHGEWVKKNQSIYSQEPLFSIKNVDVEYVTKRNLWGKIREKNQAVASMSFNLYPGETLGLVGESGCGKTTLGRAIVNLVNHSKGSITYKGKELGTMSAKELAEFRREVQIVFQDPFSSLNPRHTIGETITEPLLVHGFASNAMQAKKMALSLLDQVSLPADSYFRYPHEFSGGQRQRVVIARALTLSPKVIVCDEMVSALDVSVQAQILNLMNSLKEELGLTYLFISHDLSVVKYMSNRMLVMQNGRLIEYGSSDELYNNPRSEYTKRLIEAIPGKTI